MKPSPLSSTILTSLVYFVICTSLLLRSFVHSAPCEEEDPLSIFILNIQVREGNVVKLDIESCDWLSLQTEYTIDRICEAGIRVVSTESAAEACPKTCNVPCDDNICTQSIPPPAADVIRQTTQDAPSSCNQDQSSVFVYNMNVEIGAVTQLETKTCNWLSKRAMSDTMEICQGEFQYSGTESPINSCPITCGVCLPPTDAPSTSPTQPPVLQTSFTSNNELRQAVSKYCEDPEGWIDHSEYDMYGPIEDWDVSKITEMSLLFKSQEECNPPIRSWDTSNVKFFSGMFSGASSFDQDIGGWDVSRARDFNSMFYGAASFNKDISSWDVSNAKSLTSMFYGATSFNQDLSSWNVEKSEGFNSMFRSATAFNQDISGWNVANGRNFRRMFYGAISFNQDLCGWDYRDDASKSRFCMFASSCGDC